MSSVFIGAVGWDNGLDLVRVDGNYYDVGVSVDGRSIRVQVDLEAPSMATADRRAVVFADWSSAGLVNVRGAGSQRLIDAVEAKVRRLLANEHAEQRGMADSLRRDAAKRDAVADMLARAVTGDGGSNG